MRRRGISNDALRKDLAMDESNFAERYLALPIRGDNDGKIEKALNNANNSTRIVSVLETNRIIELPIVIQNMGKRAAEDFTLVISFSDKSLLIRNKKRRNSFTTGKDWLRPRYCQKINRCWICGACEKDGKSLHIN
jgi:hypothetical protein